MAQQHLYHLAKRGKLICPECGRKTFVPYVDQSGNVLNECVGKCDRADKCAYHYPPREYFADNNIVLDAKQPRRQSRPLFKPQPRPTYINDKDVIEKHGDIFKISVTATMSHRNNLVDFLKSVFGEEIAGQMVREYFIGTSKHFGGAATVFWQVDRYGKIHRGKVMQYNPEDGHRAKSARTGNGLVHSVHKLMELGDNLPPMCLFGEHLLPKNPKKPVAIVESEKTAIIASGLLTDCVFLACGGCGNLTPAMCAPLRDRNVILFPDNGKFDEWSEKCRELRHVCKSVAVSDIMERPDTLQRWSLADGDDIGDLLLRRYPDECILDLNLKWPKP